MERSALRKLLLSAGEGDPAKIEAVLRAPILRAISPEEVVVSQGLITEWRLCELQAAHYGLRTVHLESTAMDSGLVSLIHVEVARMYCVVPYRREGNMLLLAMADPQDKAALTAAEWATRMKVAPVMATRSEIKEVLDFFAAQAPPTQMVEQDIDVPSIATEGCEGKLTPGVILRGRYRIDRLLGKGGMGAVYLANEEVLVGKKVAVKELVVEAADKATRAAVVKQFQQEAQLLARLDHPGLVDVTDYFEYLGNQYLVMEFIEGTTLESTVRHTHGFLPVPLVLGWMVQLCDVLAYLHAQDPPVIFRDIKPANIMLDRRARIRLVDFGIARVLEEGSKTLTFMKGAGTPGFSPVEQFGGATTDVRSDIYALGATLYSILTRTIPPTSVNLLSGDDRLVPAEAINPSISPQLSSIIARMMGFRKEDRYQTVAEVEQALRACAPTGPTLEEPRLGRARILVVDDDPLVLAVIEAALESNYQVFQASDGQQGLETALHMKPDLIISDMQMPVMDGVALCSKLRANATTSDIPFIMLTSYTDVRDEERGLDAGADDYVGKPIDSHRLLARVKALLRRSQRRAKSI